MSVLKTHFPGLQRRLGRREDLIAAIAVGLLGMASLSFTLVTHTGTPAGAALAYMAAVDRADIAYVWNNSIIESAKASSAKLVLLDRPALAAQLMASAHTRSQFNVESVSSANGATRVTLTYHTVEGRQSVNMILRGGSPRSWPVLIDPAGLDVKLPTGAGSLAIDGEKIDAGTGTEFTVAVFPGRHRVSLGASHLFAAYAGDVDAERSLPAVTGVSLAGITLTNEAADQAKAAVSKAIQVCAATTTLRPAGCPQSYTADIASGDSKWTLLADPIAEASSGVGADLQPQVSGHYVMQLRYISNATRGTHVIAVGGPYLASLQSDGEALFLGTFGDASSVAPLEQPAATDATVLSGLKPQFASCLKLQSGSAPQCPQQATALYASHFVWSANADPLQGASVAWDGAQGFFRVTGTYDFTVDYDSTPPYSGTRHYQDHPSGQYVADLFWDGTKAVFIGFE
jgi:hypothetical protein